MTDNVPAPGRPLRASLEGVPASGTHGRRTLAQRTARLYVGRPAGMPAQAPVPGTAGQNVTLSR